MPPYRQTALPIIGPRRTKTPQPAPATAGAVVHLTPQTQALAAMRTVMNVITDEWLQRCAGRPPTSIIRQVEAEIMALVADGIPDDTIRRGMAAWMVKGYAPGAIPSFVNQVMNARPLDAHLQQPARRDLRAAAAVSIGERLQAQADARATG